MEKTQDPLDFLSSFLESNGSNKKIRTKPLQGDTPLTEGFIAMIGDSRYLDFPTDLFNETIGNFSFGEIWISGPKHDKNRVRFRLKDFNKLIADPDAFVDAVFDKYKAQRKAAQIANLRRTAIGLAAATKALHDQGLDSRDAISAAIAATQSVPNKSDFNLFQEIRKSNAESSIAETAVENHMHINDDEIREVARYLSSVMPHYQTTATGASTLSPQDRNRILHKISPKVDELARRHHWTAAEKNNFINEVLNKYTQRARRFEPTRLTKGGVTSSQVLDAHINALTESLDKRIDASHQRGDHLTAKKLMEIKRFVKGWHQLSNASPNSTDFIRNATKTLRDLDNEIAHLTPGSPEYITATNLRNELASAINDEKKRTIDPRYGDKVWDDTQDPIARMKNVRKLVDAHVIAENFKEIKDFQNKEASLRNQLAQLRADLTAGRINRATFVSRTRNIGHQIRDLQLRIQQAKRNVRRGTDPRSKSLKRAFVANNLIRKYTLAKDILDGYRNLIKEGGLVEAMWDGTAFFAYQFSPGFMAPGTKLHFSHDENYEHVLVLPKSAGRLSPVTETLVGMYYLRPLSIVKSFIWNGEGFGYIVWLKQRRLSAKIRNDMNIVTSLSNWASLIGHTGHGPFTRLPSATMQAFKQDFIQNIFKRNGKDWGKFFDDMKNFVQDPSCLSAASSVNVNRRRNFVSLSCALDFDKILKNDPLLLVDSIINLGRNNPALLNDPAFRALFNTVRHYERALLWFKKSAVARFARVMSKYGPAAIMNKIQKAILTKFGIVLNGKSWFSKGVRAILTKFFKNNKVFQKAVLEFTAGKIALADLIKAGVRAVLEAIGISVGGPLGEILAWIISEVVFRVFTKVAKVATKAVANAFYMSIMISLFLLIVSSEGMPNIPNATFQSVLPQHSEVYVYASGTEPLGSFGNDILDDPPAPPVPHLQHSGSCLISGSGPIYCMQGFCGSFSHAAIKDRYPVDLSTGWKNGKRSLELYAPDYCDKQGANCTVTYKYPGTSYCMSPHGYIGEVIIYKDDYNNVEFFIDHVLISPDIVKKLGGHCNPSDNAQECGSSIKRGATISVHANEFIGSAFNHEGALGCWDGMHFHIEAKWQGKRVDAIVLLNQMGCDWPNLPSANSCRTGACSHP